MRTGNQIAFVFAGLKIADHVSLRAPPVLARDAMGGRGYYGRAFKKWQSVQTSVRWHFREGKRMCMLQILLTCMHSQLDLWQAS